MNSDERDNLTAEQSAPHSSGQGRPEAADPVKRSILEKIATGEVKMRPKREFIMRFALLATVSVLTFATLALLVSYVIFSLKVSHRAALLDFGPAGLSVFLVTFPWRLLILELALLVLLGVLLKRFSIGYRNPLLFVFGALLAVSIFAGFALDIAQVHEGLLNRAERRALPVFGPAYRGLRRPPNDRGVFIGTIKEVDGDTFVIFNNDFDIDTDDGEFMFQAPPEMHVSDRLKPGDRVFIAGDAATGTIKVYGIRIVQDDWVPPCMPSERDQRGNCTN